METLNVGNIAALYTSISAEMQTPRKDLGVCQSDQIELFDRVTE